MSTNNASTSDGAHNASVRPGAGAAASFPLPVLATPGLRTPDFLSQVLSKNPDFVSDSGAVWKTPDWTLAIHTPDIAKIMGLGSSSGLGASGSGSLSVSALFDAIRTGQATFSGGGNSSGLSGSGSGGPAGATRLKERNPFAASFGKSSSSAKSSPAPASATTSAENNGTGAKVGGPFEAMIAAAAAAHGEHSGQQGQAKMEQDEDVPLMASGRPKRKAAMQHVVLSSTPTQTPSPSASFSALLRRPVVATPNAPSSSGGVPCSPRTRSAAAAEAAAATAAVNNQVQKPVKRRKLIATTSAPDVIEPIKDTDSEEVKARKRRERNRLAAARCRQRKIDREETLREQLDELRGVHEKLFETYQREHAQLVSLKQAILSHSKQGCTKLHL